MMREKYEYMTHYSRFHAQQPQGSGLHQPSISFGQHNNLGFLFDFYYMYDFYFDFSSILRLGCVCVCVREREREKKKKKKNNEEEEREKETPKRRRQRNTLGIIMKGVIMWQWKFKFQTHYNLVLVSEKVKSMHQNLVQCVFVVVIKRFSNYVYKKAVLKAL